MNITNLRKEMEEELVGNILPFWLNKIIYHLTHNPTERN